MVALFRWNPEPQPEVVEPNMEIAYLSDFFGYVVGGQVVEASATPGWFLIRTWYYDEWARGGQGGYRHMQTWEGVERSQIRPLKNFLAEKGLLNRAVIAK